MNSGILLIYFSHTGRAKKIAALMSRAVDCETDEIVPVTPYPDDKAALRRLILMQGVSSRPKIRKLKHDLSRYGTVILGTPVWENGLPPPVMTFLESYDWRGIKLYPFFTSGGIYMNAYSIIKDKCKGAGIADPLYLIYDDKGNLLDLKE